MAYGQQHFLVGFFTPATPSPTCFSDFSLSVVKKFNKSSQKGLSLEFSVFSCFRYPKYQRIVGHMLNARNIFLFAAETVWTCEIGAFLTPKFEFYLLESVKLDPNFLHAHFEHPLMEF